MKNAVATPTDHPEGRGEAGNAQTTTPAATKAERAFASPTRTWGLAVSLFLIGVLFAATTISGYWAFGQLQQARQERRAFAQQLSQQNHERQRQHDAMELAQRQLREERQQQLRRHDALTARLQHQQTALATLEQKFREPGRALMTQWRVETARMLLSGVSTQLEMHHDTAAACRLLGGALSMLATLPDARLIDVRRAIAAEQTTLSAMQQPDLRRYRYQLGDHIIAVDSLPLRTTTLPPVTWDGGLAPLLTRLGSVGVWLDDIAQRLGSLVEVHAVEAVAIATGETDAEAAKRPRARLRLYLTQLQLALALHDKQGVHGNADRAAEWLALHFDPNGQPVTQMRSLLEQLGKLQIVAPPFREPPSLRALDQLIAASNPAPFNPTTSKAAMP